jgi:AcrR family transcriptional regulator
MEAAIETFISNPAASMSEIAIKAGIGRATLHRHFRSRDELAAALGLRCIEETNQAVAAVVSPEQPSLERLERALSAIIPLGDRYSFLHRSTSEDKSLIEAYRAQLRWVEALVSDLKIEGHLDPEVPDSWALALIDQLIWSAWEQVSRGYLSESDAADLAVRTLLRGLGNNLPDRNSDGPATSGADDDK